MTDPLVRSSVAGTAVFTLVSAAAAGTPGLTAVAAVLDVVLFALGCLAFVAAFLRAAARSRTEELTVSGVWLLSGTAAAPVAPPDVRRLLLGALVVQIVVAFVTAGARPFTGLAFGVLVPMFGLGLCGLWAAQRGTFPPKGARSSR